MIKIRSFCADDTAAVARILQSSVEGRTVSLRELQLSLRASKTLIADRDGTPVGFACLDIAFGCTACVTADLAWLCVLPEWRGRGIGRALVASLEKFAAANAVSSVRASIPESTAPFFERLGYTVSATAAVKRI